MLKKSKNKKRLVLLDAHAIIHRAYHALPDFTSGETGEPTGALYGLSAMLLKIIKDLNPDYLVAAYDLPEPTQRHKAFTEYKAGREKTDDALVLQIERSRDLLSAFGVPIYDKPGFEADDIIGTIVEKLKEKKDLEIVIASGDMDTLQLVSGKHVRVYTLRKGIKDTIVYDETAVKERFGFPPTQLPDYKGLRGDPSDNIPGVKGIGEKTATSIITAFGGIDSIYGALKKDKDSFMEKAGVTKRIAGLLQEHEEEARFSKELGEIRTDAPISFSQPKKAWKDFVEPQNILTLFGELGFRTLSERVRSFFEMGREAVESKAKESEEEEKATESEITKTALALWVLNSESTNPSVEDVLQFAKTTSFANAKKYIFDELETQGLMKVYTGIELPLIPIVAKMKERGIRVDIDFLKNLSRRYHTGLNKIEEKIYKQAKTNFNINSPQQLAEVLFDKLGLTGKGRTATGRRSTRESELQKLLGDHPIIEEILKHRELQKLLSTYIDNLPALVSPDGRLHADFLQAGTTTGRMASQNPNLQNIPIRTDLGKVVRNAFVAEDGYVLIALDYSQIELRVAALLSDDKNMIDIFSSGGDFHSAVARDVFGEETHDTRRKAKVINFGILYGMGANALAKATGVKRTEAQEYLKNYFAEFSGLKDFIENTKAMAHKNGYTETLFGRRRYFPGLSSHLPYVRAEAERMAVNAPLQGTAADTIKIAMRNVDEWITKEKLGKSVYLVMQIHDELVYEVKDKEAKNVAQEIKKIMEGALPKKYDTVPLVSDAAIGKNWGETNKI